MLYIVQALITINIVLRITPCSMTSSAAAAVVVAVAAVVSHLECVVFHPGVGQQIIFVERSCYFFDTLLQ